MVPDRLIDVIGDQDFRARVVRPLPERCVEYEVLFEERNYHILAIDAVRALMGPRVEVLRACLAARVAALEAELGSVVAEHEAEIRRIEALMDPMLFAVNT